jgi:thiol-disulfide isomerase/thioredoxin
MFFLYIIMQGDEVILQKALNMVHKNYHEYVAVLFYASWCPFSRIFRPVFSILSSLHPTIPHFAIEESSVRPRFVSFCFLFWSNLSFIFGFFHINDNCFLAVLYPSMVSMVSLHYSFWILLCVYGIMDLGPLALS